MLEKVCLKHGLVTEKEAKALRPGGASNAELGAQGWLRNYVQLQRRHAALERRSGTGEADDAVSSALRNTPGRVELLGVRQADGSPKYVYIYPKSFHALAYLAQRDALLQWLAERTITFHEASTERIEALDHFTRSYSEMEYQQRICAWIVCTEGVGLPFDESEQRPEPPEWTKQLDPMDIYRIMREHWVVNALRVQAVETLLPKVATQVKSDASWSVFFSSAALELKMAPASLMRDWSLAAVLATVQVTVRSREHDRQKHEAA